MRLMEHSVARLMKPGRGRAMVLARARSCQSTESEGYTAGSESSSKPSEDGRKLQSLCLSTSWTWPLQKGAADLGYASRARSRLRWLFRGLCCLALVHLPLAAAPTSPTPTLRFAPTSLHLVYQYGMTFTTAGPSKTPTAPTASAVEVTLHPLPILSIAEHHGRTRLNRPGATAPGTSLACSFTQSWLVLLTRARVHGSLMSACFSPVFGGLLGAQKGREIEIVTSYELAYVRRQANDDANAMDVEGSPSVSAATGMTEEGEVDWAFFEERTASCESLIASDPAEVAEQLLTVYSALPFACQSQAGLSDAGFHGMVYSWRWRTWRARARAAPFGLCFS